MMLKCLYSSKLCYWKYLFAFKRCYETCWPNNTCNINNFAPYYKKWFPYKTNKYQNKAEPI